jgi:1,4-dihydroxy-2-naphthoate polyprenyltransferase
VPETNPWLLAARPRTLPAAVTPVVVGSSLALADDAFRWDAFVAALVGALAIQVAANFANDASDASRGADTPDRIGPTRVVASGMLPARSVWAATWLSFGVATLAGVWLIAIAGWVVAVIGVASIVATLGYVGGPVPYGYRGLGEVFVFVFFGLVATVGSRYVHDRTAPLDAWALAVPVGALIAAILVANNLRDLPTDAAAGKRTLAVLMGRRRTVVLYRALVFGSFGAIGLGALTGVVAPGALLALAAAPLALGPSRVVGSATDGPALIAVLVGTARLQLVAGVLVAIGVNL